MQRPTRAVLRWNRAKSTVSASSNAQYPASGHRTAKPKASEVLTRYLIQRELPPWTSYFVRFSDVVNDQRGFSHFNWKVRDQNYHILRTGCYPYMKYHCTRRPYEDLSIEDKLFRVIKVMNFGIPCLAYGIAAHHLISHREKVIFDEGIEVTIHFLYKEDIGAIY